MFRFPVTIELGGNEKTLGAGMAMESRYSVSLPKRYYRVFSVVVAIGLVSYSGESVS